MAQVIELPQSVTVFDFSRDRLDESTVLSAGFGVGRYNEKRPSSYGQALFQGAGAGAEPRDVHMGVDLFAPEGTEVFAFADGRVVHAGYNAEPGDYGFVLVLETELEPGFSLYALYGHLSARELATAGARVAAGARLGRLGGKSENGGWVPHLHFQLAWERPATHDLPGVVRESERLQALLRYPDPRLVLGAIY